MTSSLPASNEKTQITNNININFRLHLYHSI